MDALFRIPQRPNAMSYVLKKSSNGQYMFNLKAANGEVILTSELYAYKQSAEAGIHSVRTNGIYLQHYSDLVSASGAPYFVLKAPNNQIIGVSQMYSSRSAADQGKESVKVNCSSHAVDDQT